MQFVYLLNHSFIRSAFWLIHLFLHQPTLMNFFLCHADLFCFFSSYEHFSSVESIEWVHPLTAPWFNEWGTSRSSLRWKQRRPRLGRCRSYFQPTLLWKNENLIRIKRNRGSPAFSLRYLTEGKQVDSWKQKLAHQNTEAKTLGSMATLMNVQAWL